MINVSQIIYDCGGHKPVAAECGVTTHATAYWVKTNSIPAKHWLDIVDLTRDTRGPVTLEDLASAQSKGAAS